MVSLVDSMGKLHLSSSALGAADDRDDAEDEANRGYGPPEPCQVDTVTVVIVSANTVVAASAAASATIIVCIAGRANVVAAQ